MEEIVLLDINGNEIKSVSHNKAHYLVRRRFARIDERNELYGFPRTLRLVVSIDDELMEEIEND